MTKLLPIAALAVTFVVAGQPADKPAADNPAPDKKTDKELLQGAWLITAAEMDGKPFKELTDKKTTLTFKGDAVIDSAHPDEKATFKIDADKKPPVLDLKIVRANETQTVLAIYELKGDTLTLCMADNEKQRPKEFTSKGENMLLTLKRQKTDDAKPKDEADRKIEEARQKIEQAKQKVDLAQTKVLTQACQAYKLNTGEYPPDLETLAKPQPNGGQAYVEAAALKSKTGGAFKYDPAGPKNAGLKPDIWVEIPGGKVGNWMKELPGEEKKPEK